MDGEAQTPEIPTLGHPSEETDAERALAMLAQFFDDLDPDKMTEDELVSTAVQYAHGEDIQRRVIAVWRGEVKQSWIRFLERCKAAGRTVTVPSADGPRPWYLSDRKRTKVRDTSAAFVGMVRTSFERLDGDLDEVAIEVAKVLASDWVKPGALRTIYPEVAEACLDVSVVTEAKTGAAIKEAKLARVKG